MIDESTVLDHYHPKSIVYNKGSFLVLYILRICPKPFLFEHQNLIKRQNMATWDYLESEFQSLGSRRAKSVTYGFSLKDLKKITFLEYIIESWFTMVNPGIWGYGYKRELWQGV